MIEQASLVIGEGNWAVKSDSLLGYKINGGKYYPREMSVVRATTGTRINENGLVEVVPYNFVMQSSNLGSWNNLGVTITTGVTDAFGGDNAVTMSNISSGNATDYIAKFSNSMGLSAGTQINYSVYLKGTGTIGVQIERGVGGDYFLNTNIVTLTNNWVRYDYSYTIPSGVNAEGFHIYITNLTGTTATSVDICFPQVTYGSSALDYLPTTDRLDVARIDYSSGSGALLVEPQRTNLALYSSSFDNAAWAVSQVTILANVAVAPNGTNTADKLIESNTNGLHEVYSNTPFSLTSGIAYTKTIYAKSSERTQISLNFVTGGFGQGSSVIANLTTGTLGTVNNYGGVTGSTATITNANNGWYRISITMTPVTTAFFYADFSTALNGNASYLGNGTSGVYIWGAQLEAGSYPTSLIPTQGSTVTRNADVISKTGIADLIGQTEGTLFVEFNYNGVTDNSTARKIISLNNGTSDNLIDAYIQQGSTTLQARVRAGASSLGSITSSNLNSGNYKIAYAYKNSDFVLYINGTQIGSVSSGTISFSSAVSIVQIGDGEATSDQLGSGIKASAIWKTRLTNAELATLTTI